MRKVIAFVLLTAVLSTGCWMKYGFVEATRNESLQRDCDSFYVRSEPPGAKVYVDDMFTGITPVTVTLGYFTKSWEVCRLEKWGNNLSHRNNDWEYKNPKLLRKESSPCPQTYTIVIYLDGYEKQSFKVTVPCDDVPRLAYLKATAPKVDVAVQQQQQQTVVVPPTGSPAAALGSVNIISTPDGAEVFLDGLYVGNTPASLMLKEGLHKIELKVKGFKTWTRHLNVLPGSSTTLQPKLKKAIDR